jgi:hypothetical protein
VEGFRVVAKSKGGLPEGMQRVMEKGRFVDRRHLFDKTTILWALIGVIHVQDFHPDPESGAAAD